MDWWTRFGQDKTEAVRYLTDSFLHLRKAIATIDAGNSTEPVKTPFGKIPKTPQGWYRSPMWIGNSKSHGISASLSSLKPPV